MSNRDCCDDISHVTYVKVYSMAFESVYLSISRLYDEANNFIQMSQMRSLTSMSLLVHFQMTKFCK